MHWSTSRKRLSLNAVICATALVLLTAISCTAATELLVKDGQSLASIVVPVGAAKGVGTAARDLASYLQQMSGAVVPVVSETASPSGYRILIGSTQLSPVCASGVTEEKVGFDGFVIKSVAGGVVIAGRNDQGTVNGVYHFAEEVLGIHWYSVEDDGPTVPKRGTVKIPSLSLTVKPEFEYRSQYFSFQQTGEEYRRGKETTPLARKMSANRDKWWTFNRLWGMGHNVTHIFFELVPDSLFETHPEYFPYIDYTFDPEVAPRVAIKADADGNLPFYPRKSGRYCGNTSFQRCLSNPEVIRMAAEWTAKQFDSDASRKLLTTLSANDGPWWCECDNCKATGATISERNLAFVNAVAKINEAKYPDRGYIFLAYLNTIEPPKGMKVHRNLVPIIAPLWQCRIHPISSDCPDMVHLREIVDGWAAMSSRIAWYRYISDGPFTFPGVVQMAEEMRYFRDRGSIGGLRENQFVPRVNWALMNWAESKLFWDADKDPVKLRREFIRGHYGKAAAKPVEKVYDTIEKELRSTIGNRKWGWDDGSGLHSLPADEILKPVVAKCRVDIDAALKASESSPEPFRGRIVRDMDALLGKKVEF